jgi:hypothetical protein
MNKPRVLIRTARARTFGSKQTVTRPFQLVPRAVLLSAVSLTQEQPCRARARDCRGFLVKNVRISLFNLVCTQVFTLWPPKVLRERNIPSSKFKSAGGKSRKTGGRTPLFRHQSAQKVFEVAPAPFDCEAPHADGQKSQRPRADRQCARLIA